MTNKSPHVNNLELIGFCANIKLRYSTDNETVTGGHEQQINYFTQEYFTAMIAEGVITQEDLDSMLY